jgi:hypothetical protein
LSGWPSETDSDVKTWQCGIFFIMRTVYHILGSPPGRGAAEFDILFP